jgi:AcrR family transcriptional regulator
MEAMSTTDMRAVLLDAALTVLDRDGPAGLTVRAITHEAGCSTTGVYTYFGGKHGLVEAIYLDGFESFDRAVSDRLIEGEILEAGRAYRRWALANPTHYMVMFGRAVPDFVPSDEARARAAESFQTLVDAVATLGAPDPVTDAYHLYATVHGYVMLELVGLGPADPATLDTLYEAGLARCTDLDGAGRR